MKDRITKLTEYLQNFANNLGLTVHICYSEDKRKNPTWFLSRNGTSVSPKLDYENLNSFMLGWSSATKEIIKQF